MNKRLENYLNKLVGYKLNSIKFACQMMMFDFGKYAIHSQCLTRISKNDDILFTSYDYQSWDGKDDENNDEWYFFDKYKKVIINGIVTKVIYNNFNDLILVLDNGVSIEIFVSNGYFHYDDEKEQYRLLIDIDTSEDNSVHAVVFNKHIEFTDEVNDE